MEKLKHIKECLLGSVMGEVGHIDTVDYKELGAAIDMIKDLSEAAYYCSIVEAMEKEDKSERYYPMPYYRDMDRSDRIMYYADNGKTTMPSHYSNGNLELRDYREGRSPVLRKTYMERKMHGGDKMTQMHELEKYMHELGTDITEMVEGASPEEKQLLQKKLTALATKIV